MAKNKASFNPQISGARKSSSIKSISFFDSDYVEEKKSPIDIFNTKKATPTDKGPAINKLIICPA